MKYAEDALNNVTPRTLMTFRTEDKAPGWNVAVFDTLGNEIEVPGGVGLVLCNNPKMGVTASYGLTPGGYDGVLIHENGGGGDIVVPYFFKDGELYIGLVEQNRFTQGGKVLNLPRGYRDPGKNALQNAVKEFNEEVGVEDAGVVRIFTFDGNAVNANSGAYETWGPGEGCRFHGFQISLNAVSDNGDGSWKLQPAIINRTTDEDRKKEAIFGAVFLPWRRVVGTTTDMFTLAGVMRLIAYIDTSTRQ